MIRGVIAMRDAKVRADVEQIVLNDFEKAITPAHSAVSVGSSTTAIIAANSARRYLLLVNDSDEVIYVKLGAAAVANQGIRINASGGTLELSPLNGNLYRGAVNGICASGSKTMLVTEGT